MVRRALRETKPSGKLNKISPTTDMDNTLRYSGNVTLGLFGDTDDDDNLDVHLSGHLQNPVEDPKDCYGPVPPAAKNPYTEFSVYL